MKTRIRFEPADFEVEVEAPIAIIDVTDANPAADVPYSCRAATCGTCRVNVLHGANALSEPEQDELDVLDLFGDDPADVRLCCQAKVIDGEPEMVVLRVYDE